MAKKPARKEPSETGPSNDEQALARATRLFERGDYVQAAAALEPLRRAAGLSEGARREADELYTASTLDPVTWQVVVGGVALLGFVLAFTASIQP